MTVGVTLYNGVSPAPTGEHVIAPQFPSPARERGESRSTQPPCGIIPLLSSHPTSRIGISFPHDLPSLRDLRTPIFIFCGVCPS